MHARSRRQLEACSRPSRRTPRLCVGERYGAARLRSSGNNGAFAEGRVRAGAGRCSRRCCLPPCAASSCALHCRARTHGTRARLPAARRGVTANCTAPRAARAFVLGCGKDMWARCVRGPRRTLLAAGSRAQPADARRRQQTNAQQRGVNELLVVGVEGGGALVQHGNAGYHVETARERQSLLLAQA